MLILLKGHFCSVGPDVVSTMLCAEGVCTEWRILAIVPDFAQLLRVR